MDSYIYVITNKENNKKYVGKTSQDIKIRFKEHLYRAAHHSHDYLPLYAAINKYGFSSFSIELVEVVNDIEQLNNQEIFWIKEYHSLSPFGYNVTLGGEGTILYDREEICNLFRKGLRQKDIIALLGVSKTTLWRIRKSLGIEYYQERPGNKTKQKEVYQYSLDDKFMQKFKNLSEAAEYVCSENQELNKEYVKINIGKCCRQDPKRKSAYKYKWKYSDINYRFLNIHKLVTFQFLFQQETAGVDLTQI